MENGGGDSQPRAHRIIEHVFEIDQEEVDRVCAMIQKLENRQTFVVARRTYHKLTTSGVPYRCQEILLSDKPPENSDA